MRRTIGLLCAAAWLAASGALAQNAPYPAQASTDLAGTVITGGSYQLVLSSSSQRRGCLFQNPQSATETLYIFVIASGETLASASNARAFGLAAGQTFNCQSGSMVITDALALSAATTGHAFSGVAQQ